MYACFKKIEYFIPRRSRLGIETGRSARRTSRESFGDQAMLEGSIYLVS